jgi:hypothetical protein
MLALGDVQAGSSVFHYNLEFHSGTDLQALVSFQSSGAATASLNA